MKSYLIPFLIAVSIPAFGAKMKDAKCSDIANLKEVFTPRYLAVIDGYDKAGKKVSEEVDMGDIVTESKKVNEVCGENKSTSIDAIKKDYKASATKNSDTKALNPMNAKCEDFVALSEETQPVAIFWVAGHDKTGKIKNGEIDEEFLSRPIATLIEECKKQPKVSFYEKAKNWLKKRV
jgi:acid stress chaperone HdeA